MGQAIGFSHTGDSAVPVGVAASDTRGGLWRKELPSLPRDTVTVKGISAAMLCLRGLSESSRSEQGQFGRSVGPCNKYGFLVFVDPGPREAPGWPPWAMRGPFRDLRQTKAKNLKT